MSDPLEDDLREALHLMPPSVPRRLSMFDTIARRAKIRHRQQSFIAVAGIAVAIGVAVPGALFIYRHVTGPAVTMTAASGVCPRLAPDLITPTMSTHSGIDRALVPQNPTALTVCSYSGYEGGGGGLPLQSSFVAPSLTHVGHLVAELNALPQVKGGRQCELDEGHRYLLLFSYSQEPNVVVDVRLTGCEEATNGIRKVQSNPDIAAAIANLTDLSTGPLPSPIASIPSVAESSSLASPLK